MLRTIRPLARSAALGLLLAPVLLALAVPAAEACGYWHLEPARGGPRVSFWIESVTRRGEGGLLRITERDGALRAVDGRGRAVRIDDGQVRLDGHAIGQLEDETLALGARRWTIRVTPREHATGSPHRWRVEILRGGRPVARAERAMAFCACGQCTPAEERRDIRQRAALYLAWRALAQR